MANLIQIKRSLNSSAPGSLANGELAFTANGDVLYIGSNSTIVPIGGKRNPGVLTANAALIANGTSYLDAIKVANATLDKVYANGAFGTTGQVLTSNSTGGVFFAAPVTNLDGLSDVEVTSASAGQVLISNSTGFFRNKSLSGDITIDSDGVVSIAADSVALGTDTSGNYVATITAGNGLSGNATTEGSAPTIAVVAGGGIVSNSTGVFANTDNSTLEVSGGVIQVKDNGIALGTKTTGNYVATITAGNGLSGNATSEGSAPTIAVVAGNGIASNATGVHVVAGTGIVSNATGVHIGQAIGTTDNVTFNDLTVNGNTTIGSSSADVLVVNGRLASDILPSANITYSLGNNTLRFLEVHAQNAHSEFLYVDKDVSISGNLTVSGSLVTINVATLAVTDSLIQLASNNTSSDTLDIGFFGNYQVGGGDHEHTGLFRDATTDTFKLFKGLTVAPTTTVDVAGAGYTQASLEAYLLSGGLVSNSTAVTLTANSTVAVNMTANSLTLTTALVGTSGGTGLASYTAEDILVANSSNGFRKLGIGTDGFVLQSNGTALIYSTLDGGTF
jgi:fibronectin-binding autotransporter adhesin